MPTPALHPRRRIVLATLAATALMAAVAALVIVGAGSPRPPATPGPGPDALGLNGPDPATGSTGSIDLTSVNGTLSPLETTSDPRAFAEHVAHALFVWDTRLVLPVSEYTSRLVAVADPTGESSPGLVADVTGYLPTPEAWSQLRRYATRQWLSIESIEVPSLWPRAQTEAGPAGMLPGTTAYTITGLRHRAGVWEDEPVTSAHDVAFTVFIVCAPSYPECHLLRLSRLNEPLR